MVIETAIVIIIFNNCNYHNLSGKFYDGRHSIFHSFYDSSCLRSSNINYCWIAIILIIHFFNHNYHLCSLSSKYFNQLVWIANITLNSNECSSNSLNNNDCNSMSFLLINLYTNIAVVLNFKKHNNTGSKIVKLNLSCQSLIWYNDNKF